MFVRGIDTSTIKADWQEIWDKELAPLLDKWFVGEIQTDRLLSDQPLRLNFGPTSLLASMAPE